MYINCLIGYVIIVRILKRVDIEIICIDRYKWVSVGVVRKYLMNIMGFVLGIKRWYKVDNEYVICLIKNEVGRRKLKCRLYKMNM